MTDDTRPTRKQSKNYYEEEEDKEEDECPLLIDK